MNRRSKNRNVCWKKPERVSLSAANGNAPWLLASSWRSSRPNVLVDHFPKWKWLSHSASRRATVMREGNSQGKKGADGQPKPKSGRSMKMLVLW